MPTSEEKWAAVFPGIVKRDTIATIGGAAWMYFGYKYLPLAVPQVSGVADHLVYALRWQMPAVALMMYMVNDTAMERKRTGAIDPVEAGRKEPESLTVRRNVLQNTFEQFILNSTSVLVLSTFLQPEQLKIVPLLAGLFVAGRVWYRSGYIDSSAQRSGRSGGMWLTGIPTIGLIAYNLYRLFMCC